MRKVTTMLAATGAALALAAGVASGADAEVTKSVAIKNAFQVEYGYGAAWLPSGNRVYRVTPAGAVRRSPRFPGAVLDVAAGYNRIWVLWQAGNRTYVARLHRRTARFVGPPKRIRLPGRQSGLEVGANAVWTANLGFGRRITRIDRRTLRLRTRRWPVNTPSYFFAEKGAIWEFNRGSLIGLRPGNLSQVRRFPLPIDDVDDGEVAYGAGSFYLAWEQGLGRTAEIAAFSPTTGEFARASFEQNFGSIGAVGVGGGVWAVWSELPPGGQATSDNKLTRWTTTLQVPFTVDLPTVQNGADIVVGGGRVWITDDQADRLLIVDPSSVGPQAG
jgi:hypothetical protein